MKRPEAIPAALFWVGLVLFVAPLALAFAALTLALCIAVPPVGIGICFVIAAVVKASRST